MSEGATVTGNRKGMGGLPFCQQCVGLPTGEEEGSLRADPEPEMPRKGL